MTDHDEITQPVPFFQPQPTVESVVAQIEANSRRRAQQTRAHCLAALLWSIPEASWPSRGAR
jgi:16S rRNA A1518/A1519 N6-dimethyltransferase RsmA/KsgA/DIM1 with predicted DNA glycosylase/AP lyase activity